MKNILKTSIIKSIIFNFTYFGLKGVIHFYALVSRDVKLSKMKGEVVSNKQLYPGCVRIGFPNVEIIDHKYQRSIWSNDGKIILNGKVSFGSGSRISNSGEIVFGNNFNLNANATIVCQKKIVFGENVLISWDVLIMDTDFHKIYLRSNIKSQINAPEEISIGDNVWIGCRCFITKGTRVKSGCVIAGQSKISGIVKESNSIIGDRMLTIKKNVLWEV